MKSLIILSALLLNSILVSAQNEPIGTLIASSGDFERFNSPVSADISTLGIDLNDKTVILKEVRNGKLVVVESQIENGSYPRITWILDGTSHANTNREYQIFYARTDESENTIEAEIKDYTLDISKNGNPVLSYHNAMFFPPDGIPKKFKRSAFIHPLYSPSGNILTRINPPDHFHHYGIWNPWTVTHFREDKIDFWNLYLNQGTVEFAGFQSFISGPIFGEFKAIQKHVSFISRGENKDVINELLHTRVWNIMLPGDKEAFLIDYKSILSCATSDEVVLDAYRYGGGIGFRANKDWTNKNSTVLTSEGKTRKDADASFGRWVDINGGFENGSRSGIVFMSSPSNRKHPESMRVWPEDMNEGRGDIFFEFCPIRHEEWVLEPGKEYSQSYRMLVYDGTIDKEIAERLWTDFAYPPLVTIIKK